jgi:hypothetical protein
MTPEICMDRALFGSATLREVVSLLHPSPRLLRLVRDAGSRA